MQSSFGSFLRFMLGFIVFISVSFGVTYAVSIYEAGKAKEAQAAAALQAVLVK